MIPNRREQFFTTSLLFFLLFKPWLSKERQSKNGEYLTFFFKKILQLSLSCFEKISNELIQFAPDLIISGPVGGTVNERHLYHVKVS